MNERLRLSALFGAAIILALSCHKAKAEMPSDLPMSGYASSLPPITTPPEQQKGGMWGTTELMRCPDGYKLSFDQPSLSGEQAAPKCVPMTAKEFSGGAK